METPQSSGWKPEMQGAELSLVSYFVTEILYQRFVQVDDTFRRGFSEMYFFSGHSTQCLFKTFTDFFLHIFNCWRSLCSPITCLQFPASSNTIGRKKPNLKRMKVKLPVHPDLNLSAIRLQLKKRQVCVQHVCPCGCVC